MKKQITFSLILFFIVCTFSFADKNFYQDTTGSDIKLAIPEASGVNIAKDKQWLLTLIQTQLINTFSKFSPIVVIDRQNENMAIAEMKLSESASHSENDYAAFGKFVNANHIAATQLINTGNNYSLSIRINYVETNAAKWTYNTTCYPDDITNGTVINTAVDNLLQQIGVKLTDKGNAEIKVGLDSNALNSQQYLSKGISAQKRGATTIEAMEYFYEATEYNPTSAEAKNRLQSLTISTASDDLGVKMQSQVELYEYWKKTLDEANDYFMKNPPYEIYYSTTLDPVLKLVNEVPYFDINFSAGYRLKNSSAQTILSLQKDFIDSKQNVHLGDWPSNAPFVSSLRYIELTIELVNQMDKIIASEVITLTPDISRNFTRAFDTEPKINNYKFSKIKNGAIEPGTKIKITKITEFIGNEKINIDLSKIKITTVEELSKAKKEEAAKAAKAAEEKAKIEEAEKRQAAEKTKNRRRGLTVAIPIMLVDSERIFGMEVSAFWDFAKHSFMDLSIGGWESEEEGDPSFFYTFLSYGLNVPIGNRFRLYGLAGIGGAKSDLIGEGFACRAGAGLDFGRFITLYNLTFEYTLDYILGNGFSDRFSLGLTLRF